MTAPGLTLRVAGLSKRYGDRAALDAVSLTLQAASFVVLLGPNGGGKSTLFQLLTGLFVPDAGAIDVAGHSMRHAATRALCHIGVVFQQMSLDLDLTCHVPGQYHGPASRAYPHHAAEQKAWAEPLVLSIDARMP